MLCKGDQILSINGRSLAGMSHNAAIKLLQKAKGSVELRIVRSVTSGVPSPELHPIDLAVDDRVKFLAIDVLLLRPMGPCSY